MDVNSKGAAEWSDLMRRISAKDHALVLAKEKLAIYHEHSNGEYQGGMEHMMLMDLINKTLKD